MEFDGSGITNPDAIAALKKRAETYQKYRKMIMEEIVPLALNSDNAQAQIKLGDPVNGSFSVPRKREDIALFTQALDDLGIPHYLQFAADMISVHPRVKVNTLPGKESKKE